MRRRHTVLAGAIGILGVLATVLTVGGAAAGAATRAKPLPVPYTFLTSAVIAGLQVNADPPGANQWGCKPSAAHPEPVVLVHGLAGNKSTNWQTYAPLLKNNGYCVYSLTYGQTPYLPVPYNQVIGGLTAMEASAVQLQAFVAKVLASTGARKVDILGHSEGTVVPDYYAKFLDGAKYIDNYVSLAPLWHGTNLAGFATMFRYANAMGLTSVINAAFAPFFASGPELLTGGAFITKLRSGGTPGVPGIRYTNIVTKYDELVSPYTSGIQAGMKNYTVQDFCKLDFTEHFEIAADPVAAQIVLNTLDPAHPHAVPCRLVLPFVGG
ncbi:MAG: alpha/beta fold hydrolase [Jatrophihabitantaceae bacterium]